MSEQDKKPSKLAADLILGADGELETELAAAHDPFGEVPLDPSAFLTPDAATVRIDVERANSPMDPIGSPEPRTGGSAAAFDHLFTEPPAPAVTDPNVAGSASGIAPLPEPRDLPAQTGIVASVPDSSTAVPIPDPASLPNPPDAPPTSAPAWAPPHPVGAPSPADDLDPVPVPAPRSLPSSSPGALTSAPAVLQLPASPTSAPPAARPRRTPLPTGLPETDDVVEHGIQALPIEESVAKAPRTVRLPCSLLVASPELAPAAQTAAKLMERGYTCRVIGADGRAQILNEQPFDSAVVEVSIEDARRDSGRARLQELAAFRGPVVLVSPIPLPEDLEAPVRIAGVLVRPLEVGALVDAIEEGRGPPSSMDTPMPGSLGEQFDLGVNMVRAQITVGDGQVTRGRVRSMSYAGEMVVDMKEALPLGTKMSARFRTVGDREVELAGKVVGTVGTLSTMRLKIGEVENPTIQQFVDEARDVTQPVIHQVVIRAFVTSTTAAATVGNAALAEHWTKIRGDIDDDPAHQAFIKACLEAKQIEFAVKCYRELKEQDPENERVQRYLNQVGTILGFYAFKKQGAEVEGASSISTPLKVALGLFVLSAIVLWVIVEILS